MWLFELILAQRENKQQLYEDVKSRHEDILRLEASVRELYEIFQDMAMLVESQVCNIVLYQIIYYFTGRNAQSNRNKCNVGC